jgi:signal transduction histidine kinase
MASSRGKMEPYTANAMSVELPDLLSVLAHELRSPLSVLQGYIRLLQRDRGANDPETSMLTSMLDATGRLATIGRHASDLAVFLKSPAPAGHGVSVDALLAEIAKRVSAGVTMTPHDGLHEAVTLSTSHTELLAGAISALTDLVMRDSGQKTAVIASSRVDDGVRLTIAPGAETANAAVDPSDAGTCVAFDRGGLGLSLVVASYVLQAHGARTTAHGGGRVVVHLPVERAS